MNYHRHRASTLAARTGPPPGPVASFTADDSTVDTATAVNFTDTSTGTPTSWSWSFGDGNTSTLQNPSHTYALPGEYTVTLTATNAGGSDQDTTLITVSSFLAAQTGYDSEWDAAFSYTDTARTTLASANGDLVAAMADRGSNGRHVSQATSGNRPTFVTVGGKPAVKFLASASKTLASSNFFDATWHTAYTLYLVWEYHGRGGPKVMVGGNSTQLFIAGEINAGTGMRHDWFTAAGGGRSYEHSAKNKIVACITYDGVNKRVVVRGPTGTTDNETTSAMTANLALVGNMTFGDLSQGGGFACNGFLFHAILYKAGHNSTVRGNILDHLRSRHLAEPAAGAAATGGGTIRLVPDGDSLTVGQGLDPSLAWPVLLATDLGGGYTITNNVAVGGQMVSEASADAETQVDALFSASNTDNIVVAWMGTNDLYYGIDAGTAYRRLRDYCLRRRYKGFKVVVCNAISREDAGGVAGFSTRRAAFNTLLTDNWTAFADAYVDLYSDSRFQNAQDTTYYQTDDVHITAAAQVIVKDAIKAAVLAL